MLKRLTSEDSALLREAWAWDEGRPSWYTQMDKVFSLGTVEDFIAQLDDKRNAFIGVFDEGLAAIILVVWAGEGRFTAHLLARPKADLNLVTKAAERVLYDMLDFGLMEASIWIAERNKSIRKLSASIGMLPDGIVMWKGSYRGRIIKWLRHSVKREQLLVSKAA